MTVQNNWQQIREILARLTANRAQSQLATQIGVNRSTLSRFINGRTKSGTFADSSLVYKIYLTLEKDLTEREKQIFQNFFQQRGLPVTNQQNAHITSSLHPVYLSSYDRGLELHLRAMQIAHSSWEQAISLLYQAEQSFGSASVAAAKSVCRAIWLHIQLGDYAKAQVELLRVKQQYGTIIDPETQAEVARLTAEVQLKLGNYADAEQAVKKTFEIAALTGIDRIAKPHLLGRIHSYYWKLYQFSNPSKAKFHFHFAQKCFDDACGINQRLFGIEEKLSFNLLRKTQLLIDFGDDNASSLKLLTRISQTSGKDHEVIPHIGLQRARIDLMNGETEKSIKKLENVLETWSAKKYKRGVYNVLKNMAWAKYQLGHFESALELGLSALSLLAPENVAQRNELYQEINSCKAILYRQLNRPLYSILIQKIERAAKEKVIALFSNKNKLDKM